MGRILVLIGAIAALALVPVAAAATPQEIQQDLADGVLDGTYSQADLQRAFANATLQGYDNAGGGTLQQGATGGDVGGAAAGTLPFTGADLVMLVVGGLVLLALGVAIRRWVSSRSATVA